MKVVKSSARTDGSIYPIKDPFWPTVSHMDAASTPIRTVEDYVEKRVRACIHDGILFHLWDSFEEV